MSTSTPPGPTREKAARCNIQHAFTGTVSQLNLNPFFWDTFQGSQVDWYFLQVLGLCEVLLRRHSAPAYSLERCYFYQRDTVLLHTADTLLASLRGHRAPVSVETLLFTSGDREILEEETLLLRETAIILEGVQCRICFFCEHREGGFVLPSQVGHLIISYPHPSCFPSIKQQKQAHGLVYCLSMEGEKCMLPGCARKGGHNTQRPSRG